MNASSLPVSAVLASPKVHRSDDQMLWRTLLPSLSPPQYLPNAIDASL